MNKVSIPKLHSIKLKNHHNVETLAIPTRLNLDPNQVLMEAINYGMDEVVICGFNKDGGFYHAASVADGGTVLWHLEMMKKRLLEIGDS